MDSKSRAWTGTESHYTLGIIVICACYAIFQLAFIPFLYWGADEFWFAHHIYRYTHSIPFRDFLPYKTVLGYYLLSIPYYFSHALLTPLYYIKDEVAIINVILLAWVSIWAKRWFQPRAIFYTVIVIISSQFFLMYSVDIRTDMLASWLCLISILFLLDKRVALSGILIGLGFLTSQKAFWYLATTEGALLISGFTSQNYRHALKSILIFNLGLIATLLSYIAFWACFSSLHEVLKWTFYEPYIQGQVTFYAQGNSEFWKVILKRGSLLFLLWPLTFLSLFDASISQSHQTRRIFIVSYASLAILILGMYKQFFPYNIVFLLPAFFVLYSELFSWLLKTPRTKLSQRQLFWFFSIYIIGLVNFILVYHLALEYLLVILIPVCLWYSFEKKSRQPDFAPNKILIMMLGSILITGMAIPLTEFGNTAYRLSSNYQKHMIEITNALVKDGSDYVAGILFFYDRDQTVPGFENLIAPAVAYTNTGDQKLIPALFASLDLAPTSPQQMLMALQSHPVKLVLFNLRLGNLPLSIIDYMKSEFEHYWGSIFLYAPAIAEHQSKFDLKFAGNYQIESNVHAIIVIDGKSVAANKMISLSKGQHDSQAAVSYRLKLIPENITDAMLDIRYRHNCPQCLIKSIAN